MTTSDETPAARRNSRISNPTERGSRKNSRLSANVAHICEASVSELGKLVVQKAQGDDDSPGRVASFDRPFEDLGYSKDAAKEEVANGAAQVLSRVQETSLLELGPRAIAAFAAEGLDIVRFREHVKAAMQEDWSPHRIWMREMLDSVRFEMAIGAVLFFNICMMIIEVNRKASCVDGRSSYCDPPVLDTILKYCFSVIYVGEVFGKIYVYRLTFHRNNWNLFDAMLVLFTIMVDFLDDFFPIFKNLKYFKILRAAKLLHTMLVFPAFFNVVHGLLNALTSIVSSFVLLMFLLLVWAIAAVLVLHPIITRIATADGFDDCPRCASAFSSVTDAFVTLMQTTLNGDSWGKFAAPVIEESPWTLIFFLGTYMTVVLGMLNVVTASTVDCTVEARKQDEIFRKKVQEIVTAVEKEVLLGICMSMDVDGNGTISLQELEDAYAHNSGFRQACQRIEVDKEKLGLMIKLAGKCGPLEADPEILITDFVEAMINKESTEDKSMIMLLHEEIDKVRARISEDIQNLANVVQGKSEDLTRVTRSFEKALRETHIDLDNITSKKNASSVAKDSKETEKNEEPGLPLRASQEDSEFKKDAIPLHSQRLESFESVLSLRSDLGLMPSPHHVASDKVGPDEKVLNAAHVALKISINAEDKDSGGIDYCCQDESEISI